MADNKRYLRGSTEQCPKCGCRKVGTDPEMVSGGYGPGLSFCPNCKTLWEPFDSSQIWDTSDPHCSFREPCNNCAFRPGSNEQKDHEEWRRIIESLGVNGQFFCHKGVPISAGAKYGFDYPTKTIMVEGHAVEVEDIKRMRMCRGFLNAMPKLRAAAEKKIKAGKLDALAIGGCPPDAAESPTPTQEAERG